MKNLLLLLALFNCCPVLTARVTTHPEVCQFSSEVFNMISGQVRRPDGTPVEGVTVRINDGSQDVDVVTDANGNYSLSSLALGLTYTISPIADEDCFSCLTVHDIIASQEYIINETPLNSPYQRLAADLNGDNNGQGIGGITSFDQALIARGIFQQPNPFSPCWTFVPADHDFDIADPNLPVPTTITVTNLSSPTTNLDFIAVKEGDVTECNEPLTAGPLSFQLVSTNAVCQGDQLLVELQVRDFVDVQGFQLSLSWDVSSLTYLNTIDAGLLTDFGNTGNIYQGNINDGNLALLWHNRLGSGVSAADNSIILTFVFDVTANAGEDISVHFDPEPSPTLYVSEQLESFLPTTNNWYSAMPGPQLGTGVSYCRDGELFIPFYPTLVNSVSNQASGTLEGIPPIVNGETFWLTGLVGNDSWSLLVNGPVCNELISSTVDLCSQALTPDCGNPVNLSNTNDFIVNKDMWGNKVVWQSNADGDNDIYVYDLLTQTLTNITNNTADDREPIIQGDNIVYRSDADGDFEIMLYNCATQQTTQVSTNNTPIDTSQDIDGNYIVWRSNFEGDNEIYLYNILNGSLTNVSDDNATGAGEPHISGTNVVFISTETGSNDVFHYNIQTGVKTNLTNDNGTERSLMIMGGYAAWISDTDGDEDVYLTNLFTSNVTNVSNNTVADGYLAVHRQPFGNDDLILAWASDIQSTTATLELHRLTSNTTSTLATLNSSDPSISIHGKRLVYHEGGQLYVYELNDNTLGSYPSFVRDDPSLYNNNLIWLNNGDVFWYDLALELPTAAQLDAANSTTNPPCPGNQATLWLQGSTTWEAVWYDDAALTNVVYADANNNFQPIVNGPATYYGLWRHSVTGCTGLEVAVNVDAVDTVDPTFTNCPTDITEQAATGSNTAIAIWLPPTAGDNCNVQVTNNFNPGDAFPVGTTQVDYVISDFAGNTVICSFDVTVEAANDPVLLDVLDGTGQVGSQICVDILTTGFMDIAGFQFSLSYDPNLLAFASTNSNTLSGVNTIQNGGPGTLTVNWSDPGLQGVALPDGSVLLTLCFDALMPGLSTVDFTNSPTVIEFSNSNSAIVPFSGDPGNISVEQGSLRCPDNVTMDNDNGRCDAFVNIPIPQLPGPGTITNDYNNSPDASDIYPVGSTVVTYAYVPPGGDTTFCSFTVTVNDVEVPTINCAGTIVLIGDINAGGAFLDQALAAGNDNCPGVDILCQPLPREGFWECGVVEVTCRAVDEAGNESPPCITIVEVICEPEPACGPLLTTTPIDTTGHDCCWTLDYSNPTGDTINAIKLSALGGITIDYTLAAGYQDADHNLSSVLIASDPLASLPSDVLGLANFCLSNVYVSPQQVLVDYYDANYRVFCTDTLTFDCPVEPTCLVVLSDSLVCDSLGGYRYDLNIQSPPGSDFGIGLLKMTVTEPADIAGTYTTTLAPPLANGQFANISFPIPSLSSADSLCFVLSAHNGPGEERCCFVQDTCLALPLCAPCPMTGTTISPTEDTCCYRLQIDNNYAVNNFFTQVQTTILNEGVYFSSIEYDLNSPWNWQALGNAQDDVLWTFDQGIPIGKTDIFDFCVDGITTTDSVCIEVQWINREETICRDTVKVFCPSCILITQDTISCDTATGIYTYTFSGENWSIDQDANTISLVESDPLFDVAPTSLPLGGAIPPFGNFGPLSFDIIPTGAQAGDTICVDLVLRNVIQDSINIECCYVTHCIVLPECSGDTGNGCSCDDLDDHVGCGFTIDINCYDLTLTPLCLLEDCDEVTWLNQNGGIIGNTVGNQPIVTTVPGPGIYTFLYQVLRIDDAGNICETVPLGINADVPECNASACDELLCVPPAAVQLSCEQLPPDFDPTQPVSYPPSFGLPTNGTECMDYAITENIPQVNVDNCGVGSLVRSFILVAGNGIISNNTCEQTITITPGNPRYSIRFPADASGDCGILDNNDVAIETETNGCTTLAITIEDQPLGPTNDGHCFRVRRLINVIDWCTYDGQSSSLIIDRNDEDCNGLPGDVPIWLIINGGNVFTDADNDPANNVPAANTRGLVCDNIPNPSGHWRSNTTHPALNTLGNWQYEQLFTITTADINYQSTVMSPYCAIDQFNCTGPVDITLELVEDCAFAATSTVILFDEGADGSPEATLELLPDGSVNEISGAGTIIVNGTYPSWSFNIPTVEIGNHTLTVQGQNQCGGAGAIVLPFVVEDCAGPIIFCESTLTINLLDVDPPADVDGDGNVDIGAATIAATAFLDGPAIDCSPPPSYSINRSGEAPNINQTDLIVTCTDLGLLSLEVYAWDAIGQNNACQVQLNVMDSSDHCSGNRPPQAALGLYPNPVRALLTVEPPQSGQATIRIRSSDGQLQYQESAWLQARNKHIPIGQLQPGIYWLQLRYTDGRIYHQRFIKL